MLNKMLTNQASNPYLARTDDEQYYTHPVDVDIMKSLLSKGHYFSISEGSYPIKRVQIVP